MDHLYVDVFPIGKSRFHCHVSFGPSLFHVAGYSLYVNVGISSYIVIGMLHVFQVRISKGDHQQRSHPACEIPTIAPLLSTQIDRAASQCMIPIRRAHPYFRTNKWVILYNSARHIIYVLVICKINTNPIHFYLDMFSLFTFAFCPPRRPLIQTSASNGTSEASVLHRCVETEWMHKTEVTGTGN